MPRLSRLVRPPAVPAIRPTRTPSSPLTTRRTANRAKEIQKVSKLSLPSHSDTVTRHMARTIDCIPTDYEKRFMLKSYIMKTLNLAYYEAPGKEQALDICRHIVSILQCDESSDCSDDKILCVDFENVRLQRARLCALDLMAWEEGNDRNYSKWRTGMIVASRQQLFENARRASKRRLAELLAQLAHTRDLISNFEQRHTSQMPRTTTHTDGRGVRSLDERRNPPPELAPDPWDTGATWRRGRRRERRTAMTEDA